MLASSVWICRRANGSRTPSIPSFPFVVGVVWDDVAVPEFVVESLGHVSALRKHGIIFYFPALAPPPLDAWYSGMTRSEYARRSLMRSSCGGWVDSHFGGWLPLLALAIFSHSRIAAR